MWRSSTTEAENETPWPWILVALGAHTAWGAYPVLARYLQTVSLLPPLSLLAAGTVTALLVFMLLFRPRLAARHLRSPLLWTFAAIVVIRSITNLLATRFTLSIYVQLITLMTPFLVVLLGLTLFRLRIPPYTGRAITLALTGALLMMSGDIGQAGLRLALGAEDWLGIGLALASSFSLALYMILIRRTAQDRIPAETILILQLVAIMVVTAPLSLLFGEDWGRWRLLKTSDWLVYAAFSLGVLLGANVGQITALRHLGAPLVSSLMAWRLVSTLLVAALLLDERLTTLWQLLGAVIVLVTVTWYLWQQRPRNDG